MTPQATQIAELISKMKSMWSQDITILWASKMKRNEKLRYHFFVTKQNAQSIWQIYEIKQKKLIKITCREYSMQAFA